MVFLRRVSLVLVSFLAAASAIAADVIPECMSEKSVLPVNNEQVLEFKDSKPNQALTRGNIVGTLTRTFPDKNGHTHFEINIGKQADDVVEVIFNDEFGPISIELKQGMRVQACGDFINSSAPAKQYPASPSGAIIHWLHLNPKNQGHEHGFLWIEGKLFGYDWEAARRADQRRDQRNRLLNGAGRFAPLEPQARPVMQPLRQAPGRGGMPAAGGRF